MTWYYSQDELPVNDSRIVALYDDMSGGSTFYVTEKGEFINEEGRKVTDEDGISDSHVLTSNYLWWTYLPDNELIFYER